MGRLVPFPKPYRQSATADQPGRSNSAANLTPMVPKSRLYLAGLAALKPALAPLLQLAAASPERRLGRENLLASMIRAASSETDRASLEKMAADCDDRQFADRALDVVWNLSFSRAV